MIIMKTLLIGEDVYEWDDVKNEENVRKHGIDFTEACTVFYDTEALLIRDDEHSLDEERFIILGLSRELNMLIVCHCYRDSGATRIFSARKATSIERYVYGDRR